MGPHFITYIALIYVCFFHFPAVTSEYSSALPLWLPLGNVTIPQVNNLPDVESWGAVIEVGNSSQICVVPSTVANGTWIMSSEVCNLTNLKNETAAQCRSRRGNFVDRSSLTPTSVDPISPDPGWAAIMSPLPELEYAVNALLQLRLDASVQMPEGLITEGQNHTTSHLGLGKDSKLLNELVDAGMISGRSWGLNSGSQSVMYPRDGNLVLGGYDESSVKDSFVNYDMNYPVAEGPGGHDCPLQVIIESMVLKSAETEFELWDNSSLITVCIEPYVASFLIPKAMT
jgi:hypothetical protein